MYRKPAIPDDLLMSVDKPARYIGGEINSASKDFDDPRLKTKLVFCFPDVYEIGMSHLGIQILYDMFNQREDLYCDRVYSPWVDMDKVLRENQIPLFGVESQRPVRDFDFLLITLQYEMCYTNILQVLDLSGIPLEAEERGEEDPIVIGGGPCSYNPEPIAAFFDIFYIGEGETRYYMLMDLWQKMKAEGKTKREFLLEAGRQITGLYIPALYEATYNEDGTIASFGPTEEGLPTVISRETVMDLDGTFYPMKPVVPYLKATQDRVVLEIMRGCIRGCRFCQAGMIYRPLREKDPDVLKRYAYEMLKNTGHEEISLSSLSSSDYSHLQELVTFLVETFHGKGVNVSLPSLRIDAFSLDVMSKIQDIRKTSLTFAPEAGSQRMRDVINKGLDEEEILHGSMQAFESGWNKVKFYFMLGLPGETEEDIKGIAYLCQKVADLYYEIPKEKRNGKVSITASSSFFVPKPFTPFQWDAMDRPESFLRKDRIVNNTFKEQKNNKSMKYNWHESDISVLEGIFARGDRKLSKVIRKAYEKGCFYDAWSEFFHYDRWLEAFAECGIDPEFYVFRERDFKEILPWDFIDIGMKRSFLEQEALRSKSGTVTPDCREKCSGCGMALLGGGICFMPRGGAS